MKVEIDWKQVTVACVALVVTSALVFAGKLPAVVLGGVVTTLIAWVAPPPISKKKRGPYADGTSDAPPPSVVSIDDLPPLMPPPPPSETGDPLPAWPLSSDEKIGKPGAR